MSTCISIRGEYGSHELTATGAERFVCQRCFVLDEDAIVEALAAAEARAAALQTATDAVCAEVEADDERHLDTFGQHLPGSVVRVAEMIRAAIAAAVGAVPETRDETEKQR